MGLTTESHLLTYLLTSVLTIGLHSAPSCAVYLHGVLTQCTNTVYLHGVLTQCANTVYLHGVLKWRTYTVYLQLPCTQTDDCKPDCFQVYILGLVSLELLV